MSNDTVKIGIAQNTSVRISGIVHASGLDVRRYHETSLVANETAAEIERELHKHFAEFRTNGEYFNIPFDAAREALDRYAPAIDAANQNASTELSTREKVQFLLECAKLSKGADRARLVLKAEALIDGGEISLLDDDAPAEKSVVEKFIDEYCEPDPCGVIPRKEFFQLIRQKFPDDTIGVSGKALGKLLRKTKKTIICKTMGKWFVKGIRLRDDFDE